MKKTTQLLAALTLLAATQTAAAGATIVWDFHRVSTGTTPENILAEVGQWRVVVTKGRKVLAQEATNPDKVFNVALVKRTRVGDLDLSVELKAVAGKDDQGGGLIWRAKDKDNYYVARYNPLEDNFRVYKVEHGKRTMFKNADIPHAPGWHALRVMMVGAHIECFYDGKKYLECDDTTFPDAGMIGLWSKADAQSYFDRLTLMRR